MEVCSNRSNQTLADRLAELAQEVSELEMRAESPRPGDQAVVSAILEIGVLQNKLNIAMIALRDIAANGSTDYISWRTASTAIGKIERVPDPEYKGGSHDSKAVS